MKTTFKIASLAIAFAGFAFGAKAQTTAATASNSATSSNGVISSIGVEAGIPTGLGYSSESKQLNN